MISLLSPAGVSTTYDLCKLAGVLIKSLSFRLDPNSHVFQNVRQITKSVNSIIVLL